jgi:antitoxin VapB
MLETRTAKLFKNGSSQAVRLPAEFRFSGDQVYVTRDDATGDVVLSSRPSVKSWADFFDLTRSIGAPVDFMTDRPMNVLPQASGVFDDVIAPDEARKA